MIVEGCYIPFDWRKDFEKEYLSKIEYRCLIMSKDYIENNFSDIAAFENVAEKRAAEQDYTREGLIEENLFNLKQCEKYGLEYVLIDKKYDVSGISLPGSMKFSG